MIKKLIARAAVLSLLFWAPQVSVAQFEDTESLLVWLETECASDTTGLSEFCDLIEYAVFCLEGDSAYCDSLELALEGLGVVDVTDSTDTTDTGGGDDPGDVVDETEDTLDIDGILAWLAEECAGDTTGTSELCGWIALGEACAGGDSIACDSLLALIDGYVPSNDGDENNDDGDGDGYGDGDGDGGYHDHDHDHDHDWDIEDVVEWLTEECAEDTTGTSDFCGWIELGTACAGGDTVACDALETLLANYDWDSYEYNDDDEDDEYEGGYGGGNGGYGGGNGGYGDWDNDDDDDDDYEGGYGGGNGGYGGWDNDDDDDDDYEGGNGSGNGGNCNANNNSTDVEPCVTDAILAWMTEACENDTLGTTEFCGYIELVNACASGDSVACDSIQGLLVTMDVDLTGGLLADENADTDGDGLTDAEELLLMTDANNADTDGDGLGDGVEVNLFSFSPVSADTNGDGISDATELANMLANPVDPCPSDINKDGTVTVSDMLEFLSDFGITCE